MDCAASARPRPRIQRHLFGQRAASRAQFGGREPAINRDHLAAVPFGFVFQQGPELSPGRVADGAGQPCPVTAFKPGVGDLLSGGQCHEIVQASVDPDRARSLHLCDHVIAQQGYKPPPGRVLRHRHRGRACAVRQRTRPNNRRRLVHLRQGQPTVAVTEGAGCVLRRPPGLLLALETRVPSPFGEEIRERHLQMSQRPLQRHRTDVTQERQLSGFLPCRQHRAGGVVADPFLAVCPGLGAGRQRQVVHLAHTPERTRQLRRLHIGRVEAVLERPLHPRHDHSPQSSNPSQ